MNNLKHKLICGVFFLLIFGIAIFHIVLPDADVSTSERRKLEQLPDFSISAVLSGKYMDELEEYLLDQFPLRDDFRTIKALFRFGVFRQADNNDVYLYDDSVFKMEYPLKDKQVQYAANKLNAVYDKYLQGMNVYYSVIPDKNYFGAEPSGHMHMDYDKLLQLLQDNIGEEFTYIDIFPQLELADYYRTDSHWRQEAIFDVAQQLASGMGADEHLTPFDAYTENALEGFHGVYYGQSALPVKADTLVYMTSPLTESAQVESLEYEGSRPVYTVDRFSGMDGYDVYLSGAQALLTITCPDAASDKELIIFRDSYGSSLTPYLIGAYSKITMVDLRYIAADMIGEYVDFADQDVLFIYSTTLYNSGMLLK